MMLNSLQLIACGAFEILLLSTVPQAQTKHAKSASSDLQQHYDAAQHFQQAGDLDSAAREYRAFLSKAQEELAQGHAGIGDSARATGLFDAAVSVQPDAWVLRLEYAKMELAMGDPSRAEIQARAMIDGIHADPQLLAMAHQTFGRALLKQYRDQDAKKEMEEAIRLDPSFANDYGLGLVCLDLDDEKCASQVFDEIVRSFGDTPAVHMQIGLAYGNSDFVPQAITEFSKVIAENPRFPEAHYSLAAALLSAGDDAKNIPEAEAELKKELEISPRDFLTYAALGKLAVTGHRYQEAETYLKRATTLNPENPDAFLYLGQMYFDMNRPVEAEPALRKAIELTTDPSRNRFQIQKAHFLLGRILMQKHQPDEAHAEVEIAKKFADIGLSHDKSHLAGLLNNSAATGAQDVQDLPTDGAIAAPEKISSSAKSDLSSFEKRLTPPIADSYNNLGVIAATGKNYTEAIGYFEHAAAWSPKLDGLDLNWGRAAFMASKFSESIPPLSRYVNSHPEDSGTRGALAMSQFMTHDYSGCIDTFKGVEDKLAAIPQMEYVFAESLVQTGRLSAGRTRLQELETAHPEIPEVHRALGEVFEIDGDRREADREFKSAILLNANDPDAHYDLGKVYLESGDAPGAISELETATRLVPGDPAYHRELAAAYRLASRTGDAEKETEVYENLKNQSGATNKSETPEEGENSRR